MPEWKKARVVDPQDCPHQAKFMPAIIASATANGSASAKAIKTFLPPNSRRTGRIPSAAARITARPVAMLPITDSIAMSRCAVSACPASATAGGDIEDTGGQQAVNQLREPQRG